MVTSDLVFPIFVLFYTCMFIYLFYTLFFGQGRVEQVKHRFYRTLKSGFKSGTINTLKDALNLFKAIKGTGFDDSAYYHELSFLLRGFLVNLVSKNKFFERQDQDLGIEYNDESIQLWKSKIDSFLEELENLSPYGDLPDTERYILGDIQSSLPTAEFTKIKTKMYELSCRIKERNDDLVWNKTINKWTIPLTVAGTIFTVIFGILAYFK
jgi:hypothetical protein